jgi:hypothetical protein
LNKNIHISILTLLKVNVLRLLLVVVGSFIALQNHAQNFTVNAGSDQTICSNDTLILSTLRASISGIVTNGYWFTSGDGRFIPNQLFNRFSETTLYIPGPNDKLTGNVELILASDDPDGVGPQVQLTDRVKINFLGNVPILCNSNLNVSLGDNCDQQMVASMLATNLQQPISYYTLKMKNGNNQYISNNILTKDHIGKIIEYSIGHECGTNTCWGTVTVLDKLAPQMICNHISVSCGDSTLPSVIGLPLPASATFSKSGTNTYLVNNFDACSQVTLTYSDDYTPLKCSDNLQGRIFRRWTATDASNNKSICDQVISIRLKTFADVTLPPNYDGINKPSLTCNGNWEKLSSGFPSPNVTGRPITGSCSNLEFTFSDTKFAQCGGSYNVFRKWTIINWCNNAVLEHNQVIQIKDEQAPKFKCPKNLKFNTNSQGCYTNLESLPLPTEIEDCSSTSLTLKIKDKITNIDFTQYSNVDASGKPTIQRLPIGSYNVFYFLTDVCGNKDSCLTEISVVDSVAPIAICDATTIVTLTVQGGARLFANSVDDGSYDNCKVENLKIAKTNDQCGSNSLIFNDYVDFCCADISDSSMVVLRVTDNAGNSNSCMVVVKIQDKIAPIISCPSNVTVSCKFEIDTTKLSLFGTVGVGASSVVELKNIPNLISPAKPLSGYYQDNCLSSVTSFYSVNLQCNKGSISRVFTAIDPAKNVASCTQIITVQDPKPMDASDINWPVEIVINGCDTSYASTLQSGKPTFKNVNCASPITTYKDIVFYNVDDACVKILREWTVVDWCQFTQDQTKGIWKNTQLIKIVNSSKPFFERSIVDTTFCLFANNCGAETFKFLPAIGDDCTSKDKIKATWRVDANDDGSYDLFGVTREINAPLAIGKHKIEYNIIDECGNISTATFFVNGVDCKKPTPYCNSEFTTVIMPSTGSLDIKASLFNRQSFDNCTPSNLLKFSFSVNPNDSIKTFVCNDLDKGINLSKELNIYVTDLVGNYEFCKVNIQIQDPNNACKDTELKANITGSIFSPSAQKMIQNVEILGGKLGESLSGLSKSDSTGKFIIKDLLVNQAYVIKPYKNDNVREELATNDIIFIQRHILGLTPFSSSHKLIAADMDYNGRISVSDLVILRKLILGVSESLPNNKPNYTFMKKDQQFPDLSRIYAYPDSMIINPLLEGVNPSYNFIGIKKGDVNLSSYAKDNESVEIRGREKAKLLLRRVQNVYHGYLSSPEITSGFQCKLEVGENASIDIDPLYKDQIFTSLTNGVMTIIFQPTVEVNLDESAKLFSVYSRKIKTIETTFNQYYSEDLLAQSLDFSIDDLVVKSDDTKIISADEHQIIIKGGVSDSHQMQLEVVDVSGRRLQLVNNLQIDSNTTISVAYDRIEVKGLLLFVLRKDKKVISQFKYVNF